MKHSLRYLLILCLTGTVTGCNLNMPSFGRPGHVYHQQLRATQYDPYADMSAAPGFDGARPRQYDVPRSQATRSQWQLDAQ